jgi:hypothetical protein
LSERDVKGANAENESTSWGSLVRAQYRAHSEKLCYGGAFVFLRYRLSESVTPVEIPEPGQAASVRRNA